MFSNKSSIDGFKINSWSSLHFSNMMFLTMFNVSWLMCKIFLYFEIKLYTSIDVFLSNSSNNLKDMFLHPLTISLIMFEKTPLYFPCKIPFKNNCNINVYVLLVCCSSSRLLFNKLYASLIS